MYIDQISIFIENETGRMADITKVLADNNIDIKGFTVADTIDFGILRCIVNDPQKATRALTENGFTASITKVIGIEVSDVPGGLHKVMQLLKDNNISLDYIYSINKLGDGVAGLIIKVSDPELTTKILSEAGVGIYDEKDLKEDSAIKAKAASGKLRDMLNNSDRF